MIPATKKVGLRRMHGLSRIKLSNWSVRERVIAAVGLLVFAVALLAAGRGLAPSSFIR